MKRKAHFAILLMVIKLKILAYKVCDKVFIFKYNFIET